MRGLWKAIAYMAEDADNFNAKLSQQCDFKPDPDLLTWVPLTDKPEDKRAVFVKKQPTKQILDHVDGFLRQERSLVLFPYELAEVNRIVYETKTQTPPHKDLKKYWQGLGPVGPANRNDPTFMEAVGALAVDGWLQFLFGTDNTVTLTKWFNVAPAQETELRRVLPPGSTASVAAETYRALSWPGGSCASILAVRPTWTHLNE